MNTLAVYADVPNLAAGAGDKGHFRRVAGVLSDRETLGVATLTAGDANGDLELSFSLAHAGRLADACLAGDRRALTTPGLARMLSATVAVLLRVSHAAGAFQTIEDFDVGDAGLLHDQQEAEGDEGADH